MDYRFEHPERINNTMPLNYEHMLVRLHSKTEQYQRIEKGVNLSICRGRANYVRLLKF